MVTVRVGTDEVVAAGPTEAREKIEPGPDRPPAAVTTARARSNPAASPTPNRLPPMAMYLQSWVDSSSSQNGFRLHTRHASYQNTAAPPTVPMRA